MKKIVIFDLDGTLADISYREEKAKESGKMDWSVFFNPNLIEYDKPIESVISVFNALKKAGYTMLIMTGRDGGTKDETNKWLAKYGIVPDLFIMRPNGNQTEDNLLKRQWLEGLMKEGVKKEDILCVFEDRNRVVKMWRALGIPCYQVADGAF